MQSGAAQTSQLNEIEIPSVQKTYGGRFLILSLTPSVSFENEIRTESITADFNYFFREPKQFPIAAIKLPTTTPTKTIIQ